MFDLFIYNFTRSTIIFVDYNIGTWRWYAPDHSLERSALPGPTISIFNRCKSNGFEHALTQEMLEILWLTIVRNLEMTKSIPILMKLGSFNAFSHKMNESGRKKCRTAPRNEISIVKVSDCTG